MTASSLLDHLAALGVALPRPAPPGASRALALGRRPAASIEIAHAERASDTFLRARWRKRVASGGAAFLLIADDPSEPDRVRVLGPSSSKAPIHTVDTALLVDALEHAASLPPLEAVRRIAGDLTRMTGDGLAVHGVLTRHTLEHRFRGDTARWQDAIALTREVRPSDSWRQIFAKLGYAVEQLPLSLIHI